MTGEAFEKIKEQVRKEINELFDKKAVLENERLINMPPEARANSIIGELRKIPDCDDIGDFDFRNLFKNVIIVKRDRLIFVVGSDDLSKLPYNPSTTPMSFIETYDYKVRSTTTTCYF